VYNEVLKCGLCLKARSGKKYNCFLESSFIFHVDGNKMMF